MPGENDLLGKPYQSFEGGARPSSITPISYAPGSYTEIQSYLGTDAPLPYDPETLNEMAYQSQTWYGNLAKGAGRTAGKVLTEILSIPGYVAGAATGLTGNGWDNVWLEGMRGLDEGIKNQMPLYMSKSVQEGGIMDKLSDTAWWGSTGADGVGFMLSMFVPGQALKLLGLGGKIAKGAGALGRLAEGVSGTAVTAAELTNAGNQIGKMGRLAKTFKGLEASASFARGAEEFAVVATNTLIEASAEANNTYRNVRDQLMQKELMKKEGMSQEQIDNLAGNAATNVFGTNLAILALSNSLLEKFVFKGFDPGASATNKLKGLNLFAKKTVGEAGEQIGEGAIAAGARGLDDLTRRNWKQWIGPIGTRLVVGGLSEGAWEEGMQTSVEQYVTNQALQGNYTSFTESLINTPVQWMQNVTAMEETQESKEFYEAAVLGGVLGGGMTAVTTGQGIKQEQETLFGTPEVKMRTSKTGKVLDKLTGRQPKPADPGMVAKLRGVVEASTLKPDDILLKDENGEFVRDEQTGMFKVNEAAIDAISEAGRGLAREIGALAAAEEDLKLAKASGFRTEEIDSRLNDIKNRKEMFLINPYINLEGGVSVFKEHIDQIIDKMEEAKVKEQDGAPHPADAVVRNMEKQRLVEKVERLSKLNNLISDTHYSNLAYLQNEPGTQEEKENFYKSNLWDKKQTGAYLDYKDSLITQLERDQKRLMAEIDRQKGEKGTADIVSTKELESINKRIEKEKKDREEAKVMYERMFDKEYQLKQFNRMKEVKKLREEKQKRVEGEIDKRNNQTFEDIFDGLGYDLDKNELDDAVITATENEDLRATEENMYADQKQVAPKTRKYRIRQNGDEIAITQKMYDKDGNVVDGYLAGVDQEGNFVFQQYNGLPKQFTPRDLVKLFFSDIRYNYAVEEKEQRDNRKKKETLEERKRVLDEERDRLLNDLMEVSNKHNSEMNKIQKQLDKVQKAINTLEERAEKLEKEKQEAEEALEKLRSLLATKQEINKNTASETLKNEIREIEKQVTKLKNFVLSRQEMLLKNQNLIAENRNKLKDVNAKYNALDINIKEIKRYQQKIEELKEDYDKGAFEQFSDVENEMFNLILEDYFRVVPNSEDVKTIKEALGKFNNHLKDFLRLFDKKYTGLKEFMDKSDDRIQQLKDQLEDEEKDLDKINKELNDMVDAIAEIDRLIERLGPISPFSSDQADAVEKLNNEKAQKIMKSNLYKEQMQKLRDNARSIRRTILQLEAEKKTVHELFSILKGIKGYQEDIYSVVGAVLDERKRLSDQDKVEMENQVSDSEPEPDSEQLNERYYDPTEFRSYERNVLDEHTLTGLHVMFDTKNNVPVDRRDAEGNLVFNDNPQAQTWFSFTEDILTLKKDRDDYTYGVYNLQNANEAQREAILNSFAYSGTLSEAEKKNALFIFVKDKNDNFVKQNGNFVFAPFRANFTNVFLTESHVLTYYSSLTNEEKESFEKLNIQEQKNAMRAFFDARYVDWLNRLRNDIDNGQDVDLKMKSPVLSGGYLNFKRDKDGNPEKNQVKDSLPEYFENGKIKPNALKVSTSPFVEINGIKYRLPKGAAYIEASNIPVILNQNLLSEDNIETVIALYGMLSDDFNASIDGVPILPKTGGGESLIKNLLNHGDDIDSNGQRLSGSRIFVNRGKVKFSIGNSPLTEINLKSLKEYTELNAIQRNENQQKRLEELEQEIAPLKDFLKTKYTFVNKNLVGRTASIPSLKGGTVVVQKQDYNDFLFANVLTTNLAKANEPRFLQVNLVVDENSFNPVVEFVPKTEEEKTKPEEKPIEQKVETKPQAAVVPVAPTAATSKKVEEIKEEIEELKNINGVYNFETQQKGNNFIILFNGENVGIEVSGATSLPNLKVKFEQYTEENIPNAAYDIISNKYFSGLTKKQVFDTWYNNIRSTNVDITKEIENRITKLEQELAALTQKEAVEEQPAVEPTSEVVEELTSAAAQVDDSVQQEQEDEVNEEVSNVSDNLVNALEDIGVEEQKPIEQKETKNLGREEADDDFFNLFGDALQENVEEEPVSPTKEEEVLPVVPTPITPAPVASPVEPAPAPVEQPGVKEESTEEFLNRYFNKFAEIFDIDDASKNAIRNLAPYQKANIYNALNKIKQDPFPQKDDVKTFNDVKKKEEESLRTYKFTVDGVEHTMVAVLFEGNVLNTTSERIFVQVLIDGVPVNFYQSTGRAGKSWQTGIFYPVLGMHEDSGWINKTTETLFYEYSEVLAKAAQALDSKFGNLIAFEKNIKNRNTLEQEERFKQFARFLNAGRQVEKDWRNSEGTLKYKEIWLKEIEAATKKLNTPISEPIVSETKNKEIQLTDNTKLEKITIEYIDERTGKKIIDSDNLLVYSKRAIVLANINGVTVPFYLTTGRGGKNLIPGWYPYFGHFSADPENDYYGWFNKSGNIENYYSNIFDNNVLAEIKRIAESLNNLYGTDPSVYENVDVDYRYGNKRKAFIDFINSRLSYNPTLGSEGVEKNIKVLNKELKKALSAKEKENQINKIINENVTLEEIKRIAEEEGISEEEVKKRIVSALSEKNTNKFKKTLKSVIQKLKKIILYLIATGSIIITGSAFSFNSDGKVTFSLENAIENILPEEESQWAKRYLDKKGLITIADAQIVSEKEQPVILENPKPEKIFQIIGTVPDSYNPTDSLLSYRSQWNNSDGFKYVPMPVKQDLPKGGIKVNGVVGVGHFLLDASVAKNNEYLFEYNKVFLDKARKNNDWIPAFERLEDGNVLLKYKKPNEITDKDIVVTPLRQFKFSDIAFDKVQNPKGFQKTIKEVKTKKGEGTYLIFKDRSGYGRFSGGSVVFIFKDKYGNTIVRDFAGSINQIEREGISIEKNYNLKSGELVIGYHDVGSFSAKPKAKEGSISSNQWQGFNPSGMTGGALLIPIEGNINQGAAKPESKYKIITLDEAKAILKNLQESDQVTTKCE